MSTYPFFESDETNQPTLPTYVPDPSETIPSQGNQLTVPPQGSWTPPIEIVEDGDNLRVYVDLPGYDEDEIRVRGDETNVIVSAERIDGFDEGNRILVNERPTRAERTITLPVSVDVTDATVDYDRGVCEVVLPKSVPDRYHEIEFTDD
jgi:HSP20 family protein